MQGVVGVGGRDARRPPCLRCLLSSSRTRSLPLPSLHPPPHTPVHAAGAVLLSPQLGAPRSGTAAPRKRPLLLGGLAAAQLLAAVWMVLQYALLVPWLQVCVWGGACLGVSGTVARLAWACQPARQIACQPCPPTNAPAPNAPPPPRWSVHPSPQDLLVSLSPAALDWAAWLGVALPPPGPAPAGAPATDGSLLEPLLRIKCLLLAAVALKRRSFRWLAKLPPEVVGCARCGAACPLFWPPAPDYPHAGERWERAGRPAWSILQS